MQGCKIIFMYDESFGQRYIDSYSFFPMALAKMPVALDLTTTEKATSPIFSTGWKTRTISDHTPTKSSTTTITCRIKTVKSLMRGTAQLRASALTSGKNCTRTALTTSSYYAKVA